MAPSLPHKSMKQANMRVYAKRIQEEVPAVAPNSSEMVGMAMLTIVASKAVINVPIEMEMRMSFSREDIACFECSGAVTAEFCATALSVTGIGTLWRLFDK